MRLMAWVRDRASKNKREIEARVKGQDGPASVGPRSAGLSQSGPSMPSHLAPPASDPEGDRVLLGRRIAFFGRVFFLLSYACAVGSPTT